MNIEEFCKEHNIKNYNINSDGSIDVNGYVLLNDIDVLPIKFGYVSGYFKVSAIDTLKNCPYRVNEWFSCSDSNITTLDGGPTYVGGDFICTHNNLTTLEGSPTYVGDNFSCYRNKLTTLKGIEKCEIIGNFWCQDNDITPENYIYILTAKIGGDIFTGDTQIDDILNTYKNEVKYLHKALSELKKVVI